MRVLTVAKKDFRDASQSRALWALVGVFVVLMLVLVYAVVEASELIGLMGDITFDDVLFFTAAGAGLFIPLAAIIVCYKSVAGERELGSIKVIMSLPTTRRDVFFGKVLGRAAVITTALAVGVLVGLAFGSILLGSVDVAAALVFVLVTVFFAVVYTGIIVGLSAMTRSTARATTYALGFFAVFELLWDVVPLGILYVAEGFQLPSTFPDWFTTIVMVAPSTAYISAINAVVPGIATEEPDAPGAGVEAGADYGTAFYAEPEMGLVVLLGWLVVLLALGYSRFDRADL